MIVPAGIAPFIIVLAGPNGAGKTTFYELFLDGIPVPFINADRIAKSLSRGSASADYEAAAIAEAERQRLVLERQSFIMETVFSDPAGDKLGFLRRARSEGYFVIFVYIGLDSAALAAARVTHRLRNGEHGVPPERIASRYQRSLINLKKALGFVNHAYLYDNSAAPYRRVAELSAGRVLWRARRLSSWAERSLPKRDREK